MEILKGIKVIDLGIYLVKCKTLVLADFHMGYEESLNKEGYLVPRFHLKDVLLRLGNIFANLKDVDTIVINGDVKHEFGKISDQEWNNTLKLIDYLSEHCEKLILIKGNHDTVLGPIADKRNIEIKDKLVVGDVLILHGDEIVEENVKTIIIGHEHPAVCIKEGSRKETYKCYLVGRFNGKNLICQPSFNLVTEGSNVLKEEILSPYLEQGIADFRVFVVGDKEILEFGTVESLGD